jgi:hypothetical protein
MTSLSPNPLAKHFRQPAIYISLPSGGKYWPENHLEMPLSNEIPVYPMTTKDEITLKTPDALLNGAGMVAVIQSCCPNIKEAWSMPSIDVDTVLISIRIASYGHTMDVSTKCPKCTEDNDYAVDLRTALETIQVPDYSAPEKINGLKIVFKPQSFQVANKANMASFEEEKILSALNNESIPIEQKSLIVTQQMQKVVELTADTLTASTAYIELEDGEAVNNPDFIREFYQNAESKIIRTVQARLSAFSKEAAIKPYKVQCSSCQHQFEMNVDFNYSSFFAVGF